MTLTKIISGGQTGVDRAALDAAHGATLETGGWAPKGWRTLNGPDPVLAEFGLVEHESPDYPPRTEANVRESDATLRIARDFDSPGERCTLRAIQEHRKPHLDIDTSITPTEGLIDNVESWLRSHGVRVLNVAGNTERTAPGIGEWAGAFLRRVFSRFVMQVSFSQLSSFLDCERKWWLRSVVRLPERKSDALLIGTRFHESLERWFGGAEGDALWPRGWDDGLTPVEADVVRRMLLDAIVSKPRKVGKREAPVVRRIPGQLVEQAIRLDVLPAEALDVPAGEGYRHCGICGEDVPASVEPPICPRKGHDLSEHPVLSRASRRVHLPVVRLVGSIDVCDVAGAVVEDNKTMQTEGYALDEDGLREDKQLLTYAYALLLARAERGMPEPQAIKVRHNRFVKGEGRADFCEATVTPAEVRAEWARTVATARLMRELRVLGTPRESGLDERSLPLYDPVHVHEIMPRIRPAETDRQKVLAGRSKKLACAKYRGCDFREICGGLWSVNDYRTHVTATPAGSAAGTSGGLTSEVPSGILPAASSNRPDSNRPDSIATYPTLTPDRPTPDQAQPTPSQHGSAPTHHLPSVHQPNHGGIETSMFGLFGQHQGTVVAGGAPAAPTSSPAGTPAAPPQQAPPAGPFPASPFGAPAAPPTQQFAPAPGTVPPVASAPPAPPPSPQGVQPVQPATPFADPSCLACRHEGPTGRPFGVSSVGDACMICQGRAVTSNRLGPHNVDFRVDGAATPPAIHWQFRPEVHDRARQLGWPLSGTIPAPWLRAKGQPPAQQATFPTPQPSAPLQATSPAQAAPPPAAFGQPQPYQAAPGTFQPAPTSPPAAPTPSNPAVQQPAPQGYQAAPGFAPNGYNAQATQTGNGNAFAAQQPAPATPGFAAQFNAAPGNFTQAAPAPSPTPPPAPAPAPQGTPAPAGDAAPRQRTKKGFTVLWNCTVAGPANNQIVLAEVFANLATSLAANPSAREFVRATQDQGAWFQFDPARRLDLLATVAPTVVESEKFGTKRVLVSTRGAHPDYLALAQAIRGLADEVIQGECS